MKTTPEATFPEEQSAKGSAAVRRTESKGLWLLFILGLVMSLVFILWRPLPLHPTSESNHRMAVNLLHGDEYSIEPSPMAAPDLFRTPGYPLFLVPFYWLFGRFRLVAVYVAQALLHAAVPVLMFSLSRRIFSRCNAACGSENRSCGESTMNGGTG